MIRIFTYFSFFPFVFVSFPGSDLQPNFLIFGIFLLLLGYNKYHYKLCPTALTLFALGFLSIIYVNIEADFIFNDRIVMLVAATTFFLIKNFFKGVKQFDIYVSIYLYLVGALLQTYFPQGFASFSNIVLSRYHFDSGARGITSFTPEPAYFSGVMCVLACFLKFNSVHNGKENWFYWFTQLVVISLVISTRAFSGIIYLLPTFIYIFRFKYAVLGLFIGFIAFTQLDYFGSFRFYELLHRLENGSFLQDGSVAHRLSSLLVAGFSLIFYPFGYGGGGFSAAAYEMTSRWGGVVDVSISSRSVSAFATYVVELGLIFLCAFTFILGRALNLATVPIVFLAILFLTTSFSIAFPGIWILMYIAGTHKR